MNEPFDPSRLQDREYLIGLVTKVSPQYRSDDLRRFTMDNLRTILLEATKKPPAPFPKSTPGTLSISTSDLLSPMNRLQPSLLANEYKNTNMIFAPSPSPSTLLVPQTPSFAQSQSQVIDSSVPPTADMLKILEQICGCLDKDVELLEKVKALRDRLIELGRSKIYSSFESNLIKKDLHRHLFGCILNAYQVRHSDLSQLIAKKYLQPDTEKTLCENQQALYQLLCQYQKMIL